MPALFPSPREEQSPSEHNREIIGIELEQNLSLDSKGVDTFTTVKDFLVCVYDDRCEQHVSICLKYQISPLMFPSFFTPGVDV